MKLCLVLLSVAACIPALTMASDFRESELGRLFTSEDSRVSIDRLRNESNLPEHMQQSSKSPSVIKVNGIVRRSDGNNTVWVNGHSVPDRTTTNGVKVIAKHSDNSVNLYVDGQKVVVKPGDSWSQKQSADR